MIYTHDMAEPVKRAAAGVKTIRTLVCMDGPQPGAESLPALLGTKLAPPPDPAETRPEVSASLSWAVLKALEKDPAQRPPTATTYASLLHVAAGRR